MFPEVGSMMVSPGFSLPAFSASSIILRAMRSFTEPPALKNSHLPTRYQSIGHSTYMYTKKSGGPEQKAYCGQLFRACWLSSAQSHVHDWRAGASQPSRSTGTIFLYIYIYISISICRVVGSRCRSTIYPIFANVSDFLFL